LPINPLKSKLRYSNSFLDAGVPNKRRSSNCGRVAANISQSPFLNYEVTRPMIAKFLHNVDSRFLFLWLKISERGNLLRVRQCLWGRLSLEPHFLPVTSRDWLTYTQTDRDRHEDGIYRASIASRVKNVKKSIKTRKNFFLSKLPRNQTTKILFTDLLIKCLIFISCPAVLKLPMMNAFRKLTILSVG